MQALGIEAVKLHSPNGEESPGGRCQLHLADLDLTRGQEVKCHLKDVGEASLGHPREKPKEEARSTYATYNKRPKAEDRMSMGGLNKRLVEVMELNRIYYEEESGESDTETRQGEWHILCQQKPSTSCFKA